jgi:hypothetical protein
MKPLPSDVEDAIETLETTQDYVVGEAAFKRIEEHFKPRDWQDWMFAIIGVVVASAPVILMADVANKTFTMILAGAALIIAFAYICLYPNREGATRANNALNRWGQIAGTLAVSQNT